MEKLTKEQGIVLSGFTCTLMCDFGDLHEDIEKRMGRPVFTSEFPSLEEEIKELYREDFMSMMPDREEK